MNSNFILLDKTERMIHSINKLLVNYPKKSVVLSHNIEKTMYMMIECIFYYQVNGSDRIMQKYMKDFVVHLSMLDFYIGISYRKRILSHKQFLGLGREISEIRKIAYGVIRSGKNGQD